MFVTDYSIFQTSWDGYPIIDVENIFKGLTPVHLPLFECIVQVENGSQSQEGEGEVICRAREAKVLPIRLSVNGVLLKVHIIFLCGFVYAPGCVSGRRC